MWFEVTQCDWDNVYEKVIDNETHHLNWKLNDRSKITIIGKDEIIFLVGVSGGYIKPLIDLSNQQNKES